MDAFDGHPAASRGGNLPGNGDVWQPSATNPNTLVFSATNYLAEDDGALERVSLPGNAIRQFANEIADDLPPVVIAGQAEIDEGRVYRAVNRAMRTLPAPNNFDWC